MSFDGIAPLFRANFSGLIDPTSRLHSMWYHFDGSPFIARLVQRLVPANPDAEFILNNADRLITVATRCVFSFGSGDGLNDLLLTPDDPDGDWRKPLSVLHSDALMMAALRVSILLDRDDQMLSFQSVHRLLKDPSVVAALLQALEDGHGPDVLLPSRTDLIEEFRQIYGEIDWKMHGRLVHLRNRGIAHLTPEEMTKSVTFAELRTMVEIMSRLTANLQHLCQTQTAFRPDILDEYRKLARKTMIRPTAP
jgi:hypothetical protein